jgi:hypothetical protein
MGAPADPLDSENISHSFVTESVTRAKNERRIGAPNVLPMKSSLLRDWPRTTRTVGRKAITVSDS